MPLKTIFYRGDSGQCWHSRGHSPLAHLAKNYGDDYHISISGVIDERYINSFNLAIFQRQYMADVYERMLTMKKLNTKLVYEIDDDVFSVPKWSSAYKTFGRSTVRENVKKFVSQMDAVFTTTEYLANIYRQYCEKVYVLPNSIDFSILVDPPNNSNRKVVLWQGSTTHDKDVAIAKKSLSRLAKDKDVLLKMWSLDLKIPEAYVVPFVHLEDFYTMLGQMDAYVGLAPLATIDFNRSKSNLKVLEYFSQGIAAVASNFGPYKDTIEHEKTGLLIDDNRDWYDAVRYLIDNPDVHDEMVKNAYAFAKENYDISKNYLLWKNAIDEVMAS